MEYQLRIKKDVDKDSAHDMLDAVQRILCKIYSVRIGAEVNGETARLTIYSENAVPELPESVRRPLSSFWDITGKG